MPQLKDEMDTFLDESRIGTQEWLDAVKEIQSAMGGIAEDADGIFTKEDAAGYNLTETKLTEQYNRGDINQEEYQQKFQGAMDYELEELGINQEEFDSYTEAVKNLTAYKIIQGNENKRIKSYCRNTRYSCLLLRLANRL